MGSERDYRLPAINVAGIILLLSSFAIGAIWR